MIKSLILVRGLPGSGKSTFARLLGENDKYPVYCIDDYFTNKETGEYNFDFSRNHLAYQACENAAEQSMRQGIEKVIVENVFSIEWEMEPYFRMAKQHGYAVHVLTLENRHGGKNVHGISDEQVRKMAAKYEVKIF